MSSAVSHQGTLLPGHAPQTISVAGQTEPGPHPRCFHYRVAATAKLCTQLTRSGDTLRQLPPRHQMHEGDAAHPLLSGTMQDAGDAFCRGRPWLSHASAGLAPLGRVSEAGATPGGVRTPPAV